MIKKLKSRLLALHRDERGADMVEYILIIAAIALPLLGVIIWFWKDIKEWMKGLYGQVQTEAEEGMEN